MKPIYIFILMFFLSIITGFSTDFINPNEEGKGILTNTYAVDQVYLNRLDGTQLRYSYTYDEKGTTPSSICETKQNNEWIQSSSVTYSYDSNGNMLSKKSLNL